MQQITTQKIVDQLKPSCFDEVECRALVLGLIHTDGARCPNCGTQLDDVQSAAFFAGRKLSCKNCDAWFTARSGTQLEKGALSYQDIVLFAILGLPEAAPIYIAERLGLCRNTITNWQKRLSA